jgi:hypothetical protein
MKPDIAFVQGLTYPDPAIQYNQTLYYRSTHRTHAHRSHDFTIIVTVYNIHLGNQN